MSPGDFVVFLAEPELYGLGVIRGVLRDGRLSVEFDGAVDHFDAQELELASVFYPSGGAA